MGLENLKPTAGSTHAKKTLGRGYGNCGKTCGRGQKGAGSRAGGKKGGVFEGGQTPLYKRIAKRGFTHVFKTEYALVNVSDLNKFAAGSVVDKAALVEAGLVDKDALLVKVLGDGELSVALTVKVDKVSEGAKSKVEAAGGKVEVL